MAPLCNLDVDYTEGGQQTRRQHLFELHRVASDNSWVVTITFFPVKRSSLNTPGEETS